MRRAFVMLTGLGLFVEKSGLGPFEGVRIAIDINGAVEVVTGAASVGQGVETVIAQICADALGVDYARVRVVHGRTDRIDHGQGAFASRVTVMTGEATRLAASKVRAKAIEMAATLLQTSADTLDVVDGEVRRRDRPSGPSIPLAEVARHLLPASRTRGEREPGLAAEGCNVHIASRSAADLDTARAKIAAAHDVKVTTHAVDLSVAENSVALARDCAAGREERVAIDAPRLSTPPELVHQHFVAGLPATLLEGHVHVTGDRAGKLIPHGHINPSAGTRSNHK